MIAIGEHGIIDRLGTTKTFGDVLAGHLEVDTARVSPLGPVNREEATHFLQDPVEGPRLETASRLDRVAVHRVARPDDLPPFPLHPTYELWKVVFDLVGTHPRNQRDPARLVFRIERVDQANQIVGIRRGAALHAERVVDPPQILDVCAIDLSGTIPKPEHVRGTGVPLTRKAVDAG